MHTRCVARTHSLVLSVSTPSQDDSDDTPQTASTLAPGHNSIQLNPVAHLHARSRSSTLRVDTSVSPPRHQHMERVVGDMERVPSQEELEALNPNPNPPRKNWRH